VLMSHGRVLFDGPLRSLFVNASLLEEGALLRPDISRLGHGFGTDLAIGRGVLAATQVGPEMD